MSRKYLSITNRITLAGQGVKLFVLPAEPCREKLFMATWKTPLRVIETNLRQARSPQLTGDDLTVI
jgi:hypothetical protein